MADRLELEARFNDKASAGVRKLGKTLEGVKPSRGMEAANAWTRNFRKEAEAALRTVRPLQSGLSGLGVGGLAAGFSLGEIVRQMRSLADETATMKELGRQSGMTADSIRRLQYAAGKLHVDPSAVTGAIDQWSGRMLDFRRKVGDFYNYLQNSHNGGLAAKIIGENPEEGFKDTLEYLSRIPDAAMRAGKSAADAAQIQKRLADIAGVGDLVPMLGKGPQGLRDAYAEAAREVKPMTAELEKQANALNESLNKLDTTWGNFKRDFAPTIIGGITEASNELQTVLKQVETAHDRYAEHPERIATDAMDAIDAQAAKNKAHPEGIILDVPGIASAVIHGIKGDGPAVQRGEDGNALHRHDDDLSPVYRAALRELERSRPSASAKWEHPDDDRLSRARSGDVEKEVREGSRSGIIQGLRELAQQQELGVGPGGDGGPGGSLGAARRVLAKAGVAVGARPRAGAGFTPAEGGGTTHAKGNFAANQREAYAEALSGGLSPMAARALVANMSGESLRNPRDNHWDRTHMSQGIVQWDPVRSARIKAQFGKEPKDMSVAEQTRAAIWEMKTRPEYAASWRALQGNNAADMIGALVDNYERPLLRDKPKAERMGYYRGFNPDAQPTPGAGTPAPSAAAIGDAAMFAAKQRLLNGGHDPADKALVERYRAQQNTPKGHRGGGWIRGPGTGTSDSIPAMLSHGEYVINARASGQWLPLLHAINSGSLARFAEGGSVGFGVAKAFYPGPKDQAQISDAEGAGNRRFWRDFFRKPRSAGGMGASWRTTLGALAMMQGESGRGLNSKLYGWDVNGPSGGVDQLHDITTGRAAGTLKRLSDLQTLAMRQHADWRDPWVQAANFKREALGDMGFAWRRMLAAKSARGALKEGIDKFENPAHHDLEMLRRAPNIVRLAREAVADGAASRQELGPLDVTIRHHPHTGHPIVSAKGGKGIRLNLRSGPTMRPT